MSQENKNDKSYYVIIALSVVLVLMATTVYAISQNEPEKDTDNTISMSGYAEQKVVPDTATLSIGVVTQAATAKEASDENTAIMSAVMAELKAMGLQDKEIQTSYVSVYPVYNYTTTQTITGYSASNSVQVTTKKLDNLSQIIDRSTAAGANQIGGISFSVSNDMQKQIREDLINQAVSDASSKSDALAKSLGVEITGVKTSSISENSDSRVYYEYAKPMADTASGAASTPVQPGESTVSMSIQVTYYIE